MTKLKKCPFCGNKDIKIDNYHRDVYSPCCENCGLATVNPKTKKEYKTKQAAIEAWNKREEK